MTVEEQPIRRIQVRRVRSEASEEILNAIRSGGYKTGDRLPPEYELCKTLGISRSSLREALSVLGAMGIIESRTGQGSFVIATPDHLSPQTPSFARLVEESSLLDVVECREALEVKACRLAAQRHTAADLKMVKHHLDELEAALQMPGANWSESNNKFHLSVAQITHNPILYDLLARCIVLMRHSAWVKLSERQASLQDGREQLQHWHREIFAAIKRRDPDAAAEAILQDIALVAAGLKG